MKELTISKNEAGQRLDKYLHKRLPNAGSSFLHKMLRKKNIILNGKKADGSEKLVVADTVQIYFSDETYEKFAGTAEAKNTIDVPADALNIIYEDEDILLINKPAGMLSQKAKPEDISANEYLTAYLLASGQLKESELATFRPSFPAGRLQSPGPEYIGNPDCREIHEGIAGAVCNAKGADRSEILPLSGGGHH